MHVDVPAAVLHESVLEAAVADAPAATTTPEKSTVE
jgi:hypothetical protein